MMETAAQRAARIMDEVGASTQGTYAKGEVRTILNSIAGMRLTEEATTAVDRVRRGDVFIWTVVGGKVRPWVALSCRKGLVIAVAMSGSGSAPLQFASRCRLWPDSHLGATVAAFTEDEVRQHVSRPYTNKAHLREVERKLADAFGLPRSAERRRKQPPKLRSIAA